MASVEDMTVSRNLYNLITGRHWDLVLLMPEYGLSDLNFHWFVVSSLSLEQSRKQPNLKSIFILLWL